MLNLYNCALLDVLKIFLFTNVNLQLPALSLVLLGVSSQSSGGFCLLALTLTIQLFIFPASGHLIGSAGAGLWRRGCRHTGSGHRVIVNKHLPAPEQAGAAGPEAANGGQVRVVQDGQLD